MADYQAPLNDIHFTLNEIADFDAVCGLEPFRGVGLDIVGSILEEAGKLAAGPIGLVNHSGDQQGAKLDNGVVKMPDGFKAAYQQFVTGGWSGLPFSEEIGGQGLPFSIALAVNEMITSANMAFSLCPLLTSGAVEALSVHGSDELKKKYLQRLVSGEWAGTMELTEPQAGSDVGALTARAMPQSDGSYLVSGTKIYITYGEHDLTENIIHLVLARTPEAPPGTKGISLFLVPKFEVDEAGSLSGRNDLRCVSLEHKLGFHASPTAVMSYGDNGGARGWIIGEENQGMRCMFTMMNHARIGVGVQGLAIADRAYQQAIRYAFERRQGRRPGKHSSASAPIVEHPDVRRMLLTMKSRIDAMRALVLTAGASYDLGRHHPDKEKRELHESIADVLTPVVKSWCTDIGVECASIGVQVHGGMGFIEETGAAQHFRDARIAPIYEGTNGIQALDLVGRKLGIQGGQPLDHIIGQMQSQIDLLRTVKQDSNLSAIVVPLSSSVNAFKDATEWMRVTYNSDYDAAAAGATPYLQMMGNVLGGYFLTKGAVAAARILSNGTENIGFYENKVLIARFYSEQFLSQTVALKGVVMAGSEVLSAMNMEKLGGVI